MEGKYNKNMIKMTIINDSIPFMNKEKYLCMQKQLTKKIARKVSGSSSKNTDINCDVNIFPFSSDSSTVTAREIKIII